MTFFVTTAVVLVASVVLLAIAGWVRRDYEKLTHDRLTDDLAAITHLMEQKMLRVEGTTKTMAALAGRWLDDEKAMDSLLRRCLEVDDDIQGVSMIFEKETSPQPSPEKEGYYERYAYYDNEGRILLETYINGDELESDPDWVLGYLEGKSAWSKVDTIYLSDESEACFVVPLYKKDGNRVGIAYSAVLTSHLTSFVTAYKMRKDIDISIYKADGTVVVAPDDYILRLSPEDMIVQDRIIDHLGWKVVLSADRKAISSHVRKAMLIMMTLFVVMFVVIFLAIKYTVRYVARPFIERQRQTDKERAVMENEMRLAADAQRELVPHVFPPFPDRKGLDLSACLHPARQVGGDLYDYFISGDSLYFCIGDVSGKGVQASLFMAATHYLFRNAVGGVSLRPSSGQTMAEAARRMNVSLSADNGQCRFVTFWMGCLDLRSGALEYVNAGHDAPIVVRGGKVDVLPDAGNMPLGVVDDAEFVSGTATLMPGDILFLYTDGVTEAMDADGHEFGKARLREAVGSCLNHQPSTIIDNVLDRVRLHSQGIDQSDDITMLCLRAAPDNDDDNDNK